MTTPFGNGRSDHCGVRRKRPGMGNWLVHARSQPFRHATLERGKPAWFCLNGNTGGNENVILRNQNHVFVCDSILKISARLNICREERLNIFQWISNSCHKAFFAQCRSFLSCQIPSTAYISRFLQFV